MDIFEPCDTCLFFCYKDLTEDGDTCYLECKKGLCMGNLSCPEYQRWKDVSLEDMKEE